MFSKMATSTLIQYLDKTQNTVSGGTVAVGASSSNRSESETFLTESAITKGQWVSFDIAQTGASKVLVVVTAPLVANGNGAVIGVALESVTGTATSPQPIRVCISGFCEALVDSVGVTAARTPVVVRAGTAGIAGAVTPATDLAPQCGLTLIVPLASPLLTEVLVYKQF